MLRRITEKSVVHLAFALGSLLILSFIYYPVLSNPAPIWDDYHFLFESKRFLEAESILDFFGLGRSPEATRAWPLTYSLLWSFYKIFEDQYLAYKVLNLIVHWINGLLLFQILKKENFKLALIFSSLFLFHSIHTETLSWILQIGTLTSTMFLLLSYLVFQRLLEYQLRLGLLFVTLPLLFCLSLMFKVTGVLFPFMVIAQILIKNRSLLKLKRCLFLIAILCLLSYWRGTITMSGAVINPLEAQLGQQYQETSQFNNLMTSTLQIKQVQQEPRVELSESQALALIKKTSMQSFAEKEDKEWSDLPSSQKLMKRMSLAAGSFSSYVALFFNLKKKMFFYPKAPFYDAQFNIVSYVMLIVVSFFIFWRRHDKKFLFASVAFFTLFLPVSGFFYIPYLKYSYIADHWFYGPSLFLCMALFYLLNKINVSKKLQLGLGLLFIIVQISDGRNYAGYFAEPEKLLFYNIEHNQEIDLPYMLLAEELVRKGKVEAPLEALDRSKLNSSIDIENLKLYLLLKLGRKHAAGDLMVKMVHHFIISNNIQLATAYVELLLRHNPQHPQIQQLLNKVFVKTDYPAQR